MAMMPVFATSTTSAERMERGKKRVIAGGGNVTSTAGRFGFLEWQFRGSRHHDYRFTKNVRFE